MKRSEFEQELVRSDPASNAAANRLLKWYDEVTRELGYVYAQRDTIQELTRKNVELSVELDSALIELEMLRGRVRSDDE